MPGRSRTRVTVADLVEGLGRQVVRVLHAAPDLDAEVHEVVLHDARHPPELHPGDVVLAVGLDPASEQMRTLLADAAQTGVAAVIVKAVEVDATEATVLAVPDELPWARFLESVRAVLAGADDPVPGDVPDALFALADAVAARAGGQVELRDPAWRLIAFSRPQRPAGADERGTGGERSAPQAWLDVLAADGSLDRLVEGALVHVGGARHPGLAPRSATAVGADGVLLATLWLARERDDADLAPVEQELREAAELAAFELGRRRLVTHSRGRTQELVLAALLDGAPVTTLEAERLGAPADSAFLLAGFRPDVADVVERPAVLERQAAVIRAFCDGVALRTWQTATHATGYLLVQLDEPAATPAVVGHLRALQAAVSVPAGGGAAALARTVPSLGDLARSRAEVDRLLDLHDRGELRRSGDLLVFDERTGEMQLAELRRSVALDDSLMPAAIRAVLEDEKGGGDTIETLSAYFASNADVHGTATLLGVHPNTVRYRLGRLKSRFALDLDDPEVRFMAELYVRMQ